VNADLLKAERELARGNTDEARVHAWNALATAEEEELPRLLEVASELGDQLLIREIDRRGGPVEKPKQKPDGPSELAWRSLIFPIAVATLIVVFAVNSVTTEPGPPKPGGADIAPAPPEGLPLLRQSAGVWIVRIGRSERVPLQKLADDISLRYGIPVGVLPEIALLPPSVVRGDELDGDALLHMLPHWYVARGGAAIIGVTDFPMFSDVLDLRRPFMLRDGSRYGVVSTADLGASILARVRGHTRYERTRKLVARGIGFLYLKRPESSDEHSLLRSQMSGTGDIDALDERL
jgi:hypothetical protein